MSRVALALRQWTGTETLGKVRAKPLSTSRRRWPEGRQAAWLILEARDHAAACEGEVNHASYWRVNLLGLSVGPHACECFANGGTLHFPLATKSMTEGVPLWRLRPGTAGGMRVPGAVDARTSHTSCDDRAEEPRRIETARAGEPRRIISMHSGEGQSPTGVNPFAYVLPSMCVQVQCPASFEVHRRTASGEVRMDSACCIRSVVSPCAALFRRT